LVRGVRAGRLDPLPGTALYAAARATDEKGELLPERVATTTLLNVVRPTVAVAWFGLITTLASKTLPHTAGSGVTLFGTDGAPTTRGASAPIVGHADGMQYELDEGPCLAAWNERILVRVDDVAAEQRWPRWAKAVEPLGLRSSLSAPLVAGDIALGAIKVYAMRAAAYDAHAEHLLTLFAAQTAILLANVRSVDAARQLSDGLREALRARHDISTAKGIVMAREGVDNDTALAVLITASRRENRPLREVAHNQVRATFRHRR
jgi:GAF domain-containing protein